jgi:serine protease Do
MRSRAAILLGVVAVAASALVPGRATPQTTLSSEAASSRRNAIVTAVEKVSPAVVSITVVQRKVVEEYDPFLSPFFEPFLSPFRRRVVEVAGIGSGTIFDEQGHILTNEHVVRDATRIIVKLPDGRWGPGTVLDADRRADVALVQINEEDLQIDTKRTQPAPRGLPYVQFGDSDDLLIGEWVIAIGNPFGFIIDDPRPSAGVGVVSAVDRTFTQVGGEDRVYRGMIQTDATINQGNSGGPLVNALGQVVGINTFIVSTTGSYEGVGFAIPINRARRVAQELLRYGRIREVWWGFRVEEMSPAVARSLGLEAKHGLFVSVTLRNSAAARAGLEPGDLITGINGEEVADTRDFLIATANIRVGDVVVLDVTRGTESIQIEFRVEEAPQ